MFQIDGSEVSVAPPEWKNRSALPDLSFLNSSDKAANQNKRPILLYVFSSDPELEKSIASFESSIFSNEKLLIALKSFDAYRIDLEKLEEGDPLHELLKKPKPMTFYFLQSGSPLLKSRQKPSSSELFKLCSRVTDHPGRKNGEKNGVKMGTVTFL